MRESESKRPVGIAILSWLHIAGAAIGSVVVLVFVPKIKGEPEALRALTTIGVPPVLLLVGIVFLLVLTGASGIGMWTGRRWGWFLGAFYYAYGIVRNLNALIAIPRLLGALSPEDPAGVAHGDGFYYMKYGARVVVYALLYLYFFRANVRAHFGLQRKSKWIPAVAQFAVCILIALVFSMTARVVAAPDELDPELLSLDALFSRGEFHRAAEDASQYIREHPDCHEAWSQLGWAHLKLDRAEEAERCFRKALELEPTWDNAYVGLGVLCRKQGDIAGARANYLEAISIVPDNAGALSSLLVIELMDGNDTQAIAYGERAWALSKNDPAIAANLAIAYHCLGDTERRDRFCELARTLGYHNMAAVRDIIDGKASIR